MSTENFIEVPAKETLDVEAPVAELAGIAAEVSGEEPATEPTEETEVAGEKVDTVADDKTEAKEDTQTLPDLTDKTLADLSDIFKNLLESEDRMLRNKDADTIKSAFYRLLNKIRESATESEDSLTIIEESFKSLYNDYKRERAEYNARQEKEREANLEKKQEIIEELRKLVEEQTDVNVSFAQFRDIQNRWKETGPVPVAKFRDVNGMYQHWVERFYDMVKINRDLRDLDFKKNYEAKIAFCEAAEKLAENENVVEAFHELQKLHDQWKEYGPVAKELRDEIWDRFKAATAVINRKYQAHFDELKSQYANNLAEKTKLCEAAEEIAGRDLESTSEWNAATKELTDIQASWRTIGFASKKDNQKIYDRFRAACDAFFLKKRDFYARYKDDVSTNLEKKLAIIEKAEALKSSTEWKKATDQFIALQKQWKEIGAVPRKKSEQLWTRFRAACDEFFEERDKQAKPQDDYYGNLKAKQALIAEIKACENLDAEAMADFVARWNAIGFVPFKDKDSIVAEYKEAMSARFPGYSNSRSARSGRACAARAPRSEKDMLVAKYNALQQDIDTYENNIGFFTSSKNSAPLIAQMRERIDSAKAELKELEDKIRKIEAAEE